MINKLVIHVTFLISILSCKKSGDSLIKDGRARLPTRVMMNEPASLDWGTYLTDEKGRPRQRLVLSLDVMSASVSGLPSCQTPLNEEFELGRFKCIDPLNDDDQKLAAGHVEQECYTNPTQNSRPPFQVLALKGCKSIALKGFIFDPPLRIDAESRELQ